MPIRTSFILVLSAGATCHIAPKLRQNTGCRWAAGRGRCGGPVGKGNPLVAHGSFFRPLGRFPQASVFYGLQAMARTLMQGGSAQIEISILFSWRFRERLLRILWPLMVATGRPIDGQVKPCFLSNVSPKQCTWRYS
jgi:hypothetical protein